MNIEKPILNTIYAVVSYDWYKHIDDAKKRYPTADAFKFRVCFYTNDFDLRTDYNKFLCFDSEKEVKDAIVSYLKNIIIKDDYDLDIYISTDAFISKDHNKEDPVFQVSDVLDGNVYEDAEGNSWISISCVQWMLGYNTPFETVWNGLGLGVDPQTSLVPPLKI